MISKTEQNKWRRQEVVRALTCNDHRHREGKVDPIKGKVMTTGALHSMPGIDHFTDRFAVFTARANYNSTVVVPLSLDLLRRLLDRQAFSRCHEDRSEC